MTRGTSPEFRDLLKKLQALGFTVGTTGKGHYRITDSQGVTLGVFPKTPSCHRSWLNCRADLRRKLKERNITDVI